MHTEMVDLTESALVVMRRMRGAVLDAETEDTDRGLNNAYDLALAVGAMVVGSVLDQETTESETVVSTKLVGYQAQYGCYETVARTTGKPRDNAEGLFDFATKLHRGIQRGYFCLSAAGGAALTGKQDLQRRIEQGPQLFVPLSTDLLHACVMNALIKHHFGLQYRIVPVAPDVDGSRAVLPSGEVIPQYPQRYMYFDGEGGGRTCQALETSLVERYAEQHGTAS